MKHERPKDIKQTYTNHLLTKHAHGDRRSLLDKVRGEITSQNLLHLLNKELQ